ncbi:MAG TPA: type II toxin-antitoxin system RelE/ParE family toxin [Bacteroidetes bacterium]|nr:type II toxin-antitoxin system RelE/ParE family toxin [Bacteroidota bacterium]
MSDHPTFYVHEKADSDLEEIFDYSVEQFGFARAEQYVYDIEQVFKDLAANPALGRRFDPDVNHYFQYPVESHSVFYAPTDKGVEIFRILHQSMLPTLHL